MGVNSPYWHSWGGYDGGSLNTGGRYDPATDSWTPMSTVGAPTTTNKQTEEKTCIKKFI